MMLRPQGLSALLRSGGLRGALSALGVIHVSWGLLEAVAAARAARRGA